MLALLPITGLQIMTDELQNSDVVAEDLTQPQEAENLEKEQGAELAPDSETQHEEKAEADVNQDAVQKAINKQHAKYREEERKRLEAEEKLAEYQRKEQELQAQRFSNLPEKPDLFDENYDEKMAQYEKALLEKAKFDARQEFVQQQQLQQQQLEQAKKTQELQSKYEGYTVKAKEFGVSQDDVVAIGQTLVNAGLQDQLAEAILDDPEGPLIAKYLSANLSELDSLQSANPYLAGAKMVEIKEKAKALRPKTSNAPAPATKVEQSSVNPDAGKYEHIGNATFE